MVIDWRTEKLDAPACAVLSHACLPLLSMVILSDQGVIAAGLCELLQPSWPCLTSLDLTKYNFITPVAATALSESPWCRQLRRQLRRIRTGSEFE